MYKSLEEGQAARAKLVEDILSIDAQLSQRAAEIAEGVEEDQYKEYMTWKGKAVRAKATLTTRLQRTKAWITRQRADQLKTRIIERGGSDKLLSDLFSLVKVLVAAGAEISQEEQLLIDDVQNYLDSH